MSLLKRLSVSLLLAGIAGIHAEERMPNLGETIESKSYRLLKLSDNDRLAGGYDREKDRYFIRSTELLSRVPDAPDEAKAYLSKVSRLLPSGITFINTHKKEYEFSDRWTSKNALLTIEGFKELSSESDWNSYLGPIALIPTRYGGRAQLVLRFEGESLRFQGLASRKAMTLRTKYWAHYEVYLPLDEVPAELKALVLVAGDPNDRSGQNGTYLLVPKVVE